MQRPLRLCWVNISKSRRINCLPWTGHCNIESGHGQRWDKVMQKVRGAHVMAWEAANGRRVQPGEVVRHTCDNAPCIESTHLLIGTRADNVRDMHERGNPSPPPVHRGEQHHSARMKDSEVAEMRAAYTGARGEKASFARKYGVSQQAVTNILAGRTRVS